MNQQQQPIEPAAPFSEIDDVAELRRVAAYFRDLANKNGARLLRAQTIASKNRQELELKTHGFSLLARLSSDLSATEEPCSMAQLLATHLNSMLQMDRAVVLLFDPSQELCSVLASAGYRETEEAVLAPLTLRLPDEVTQGRRIVSTLLPQPQECLDAFGVFNIPYFMAVPVVAEDQLKAVIVTGRMREKRPFLPSLNASDIETVVALGGYFGAYLARHRLIALDRERILDVERLVRERTAEIDRQRELLDSSFRKLHDTQQQLIMREKLASLGQMTAGVAHEIRNPLNFINNFSELSVDLAVEIEGIINDGLMGNGWGGYAGLYELFAMLRSNLDKIAAHGKRADGIVHNMLQHSRSDGGGPELGDLNAILAESVEFAYHAARTSDPRFSVSIMRDLDPSLEKLTFAPQEISRVFVNILSNGFYAVNERRRNEGTSYVPALSVTSRRLDGLAEVRVRDNGAGISGDVKANIFMPFFSTKPSGEGTGLGLSLSYDIIVDGHGGSIDVESCENEFTEFIIRLPL